MLDISKIYCKVKYYILILIIFIALFISSFFFDFSKGINHTGYKIIVLEASLMQYWLQIVIGAFILTLVIHALIQYFVWTNMQQIKDKQNKVREKSEIHNMKFGIRRN